MPMLPAEPDLFPATLFVEEARAPSEGQCWRVLHTKPRQEKALARQLHKAEVSFYLPVIVRASLIRGRRMTRSEERRVGKECRL